MRTLNDIFEAFGYEREVLFEDGEWCIYRKLGGRDKGEHVVHRCGDVSEACIAGQFVCGNLRNGGCGEEAPDSIKTLAILQAWDR